MDDAFDPGGAQRLEQVLRAEHRVGEEGGLAVGVPGMPGSGGEAEDEPRPHALDGRAGRGGVAQVGLGADEPVDVGALLAQHGDEP